MMVAKCDSLGERQMFEKRKNLTEFNYEIDEYPEVFMATRYFLFS